MRRKIRPFFTIVTLFALVLPLLSFWMIRQNSNKPSDSFLIHNVAISTDVDRHRRLTGTVSRFPYGARQVCLRFDYSRVTAGSYITLEWKWSGKLVQSHSYRLDESSGSRAYALLLESGQPLQRGAYSVGIRYRTERIPEFHFEIY
ncbi:MAG: hypothetical protein GX256_05975 [Fretibacterium sp.]|nr:hypothetical protein [Fretibacterium sp.]